MEGNSAGSTRFLITLLSTILRFTRSRAFKVSLETTSPTVTSFGGFSRSISCNSFGYGLFRFPGEQLAERSLQLRNIFGSRSKLHLPGSYHGSVVSGYLKA